MTEQQSSAVLFPIGQCFHPFPLSLETEVQGGELGLGLMFKMLDSSFIGSGSASSWVKGVIPGAALTSCQHLSLERGCYDLTTPPGSPYMVAEWLTEPSALLQNCQAGSVCFCLQTVLVETSESEAGTHHGSEALEWMSVQAACIRMEIFDWVFSFTEWWKETSKTPSAVTSDSNVSTE